MIGIRKVFERMALGFVLAGILLLVACAPTTIDWSEEVKLHDGKIIVVKRHDEIGATGLPNSRRGLRKYWQFCYAPAEIHWKSKPEYFPETFDIVDGKAYVRVSLYQKKLYAIGRPFTIVEYNKYGRPEPIYVGYRFENGNWTRIPFSEIPSAIYDANMYPENMAIARLSKVSVADKEEIFKDDRWQAHQRRIDPSYKSRFSAL